LLITGAKIIFSVEDFLSFRPKGEIFIEKRRTFINLKKISPIVEMTTDSRKLIAKSDL